MSLNDELNATLNSIVSIFFVESTNSLEINFSPDTPKENIADFSRYFHLSLHRPGKKRVYFSKSLYHLEKKVCEGRLIVRILNFSETKKGNVIPLRNSGICIRKSDVASLKIVRRDAIIFRTEETTVPTLGIIKKDGLGIGINFIIQQ